jgi:hypothetical protein
MSQDHVVRLSDPALSILDRMDRGNHHELIFSGPNGAMFSENATLAVLGQRFFGSNHIRQPRQVCRTMCG